MSKNAFGEPLELPWWVIALCAPPLLLCLVSLFIPTPLVIHLVAVIPSLALAWLIVRVAVGAASANMQSVWISLAFGVWAIFPVIYFVALASK
jgi:hypothetical protein